MSREIKFRAWNYTNMIYNVAIRNSLIVNHADKFTYKNGEANYKIMQFTGLIDKNGVEIYEGDIAKEWIDDNMIDVGGFWWYGIVKFINGQWKLLEVGFDYKNNFDDMHKLFEDFETIEIIGNIYENPELL